jgi:hypothetical protein
VALQRVTPTVEQKVSAVGVAREKEASTVRRTMRWVFMAVDSLNGEEKVRLVVKCESAGLECLCEVVF